MTTITLKGNPIDTIGELPSTGSEMPQTILTKSNLSDIKLSDYIGKNIILNIFPSIDTSTCATSVKEFNSRAANIDNTVILCVSADLPFALSRFCGAEGIENVEAVSTFRSDFGDQFGVTITTGPLTGLLSRAIVVIDDKGSIIYTQQVDEIVNEPDYNAALTLL